MKLRVFFIGVVSLSLLWGNQPGVTSYLNQDVVGILLNHEIYNRLQNHDAIKWLQSYAFPDQKSRQFAIRSGTVSQDAALALYSAKQRNASFDACIDQFPHRRPLDITRMSPAMKPMALCSDNFAVLYSRTSKTPLVVVERLNAAQLRAAKGEVRTDQFYSDPRVPIGSRAELSDYRGQTPAVDRGHLAPAANASNQRAMAQSFALSNIVPQSPESNRKSWFDVEKATRKFVQRAKGNVYVFSGPLFDKGYRTTGKNEVWVPTRLFKLVYDQQSGRAWAYILPNSASRVQKPIDYATFVRKTNLRLLDGLRVTGSVGHSK